MRVVGRQENLVAHDADAANRAAAAAWGLIRTRAGLPNQIARLGIQGLDNVTWTHEIKDAVVHDRRRLVGARIVHRPLPDELEMLNVVAVDLIQRAVTPALVVAAEHQPVTRRRVLEHFESHWNIVLHFTVNGHSSKIAECATTSAAACAGAGSEHHGRGCPTGSTCVRITASTTSASAPATCPPDRVECRRRIGRQFAGACLSAHSLEDVGDHVDSRFIAERPRSRRRHAVHDVVEQISDRSRSPEGDEIHTRHRRCIARTVVEVGTVATRTILRVCDTAALGLLHRVTGALNRSRSASRWRLLRGDNDHGATGDHGRDE